MVKVPPKIVAKQAILQKEPATGVRSFLRRLHTENNDVVGAEVHDLLLGLVAHTLASSDQPDDRHNADQDSEDGQGQAQLVQQQAMGTDSENTKKTR